MSVMADKQKILTFDDCVSTGAAARGHILEPYAIEAFNEFASRAGMTLRLKHWDDIVVHTSNKTVLAYSPDAMDTDPPHDRVICNHPYAMTLGEVKSYSAERHLTSICTPKKELEERWQIATAMAADELIEDAWLIFFNPSLKTNHIGLFHYMRGELLDEIDIVNQVANDWAEFMGKISTVISSNHDVTVNDTSITEAKIISDVVDKLRLNPCV